jgi:outer membrane lipoprotein SlyB
MKKLNSTILLSTIIVFSTFLSACSTAPTTSNKANTIKKQPVLQVQKATISEVKKVSVADPSSNSSVLRTTGSIAGSILGSASIAGSIIGSMIGSAAGSSADRDLSKKPGLEISLLLDNGENVVVTQFENETQTFKRGDKVKLVKNESYAQVEHL